MPKRYRRKCLKQCSIATQQRRSGFTGAFFLKKNDEDDDIVKRPKERKRGIT